MEEAPSPFLDKATREKMGKEAVSLANAVKYRSAGTDRYVSLVAFGMPTILIVAVAGSIYFILLEENHPALVT